MDGRLNSSANNCRPRLNDKLYSLRPAIRTQELYMQAIEEFFEQYRKAWRTNSADQIKSFWDMEESGPFYKAEEIDGIFTDWDELTAYWQHNEDFNDMIELSFSEYKSQVAGAGRRLVGMRMRWDIKFAKDAKLMDGSGFAWAGQTMGGDNHVIALLKEMSGNWKLTAWIEAPNAPINYIAGLYLKNVRSGFSAS